MEIAFGPNDQHTEFVKIEQANQIDNTFLAPLSQFTPFSPDCYRELLPSITNEDPIITITSGDVFVKLSVLNPEKAYGPDVIPT